MTSVTSYNNISQCQCHGYGYLLENSLSLHRVFKRMRKKKYLLRWLRSLDTRRLRGFL